MILPLVPSYKKLIIIRKYEKTLKLKPNPGNYDRLEVAIYYYTPLPTFYFLVRPTNDAIDKTWAIQIPEKELFWRGVDYEYPILEDCIRHNLESEDFLIVPLIKEEKSELNELIVCILGEEYAWEFVDKALEKFNLELDESELLPEEQ